MTEPFLESPPPPRATLRTRLIRGGFWVVSGKFVTSLSTLLVGALVARLLPPEQVGLYFLGDRITWLIAMLGLLGMNTAVVRVVAESLGSQLPGRARSAVARAYGFATAGILTVAGMLVLGGGRWVAEQVWDSPELAGVMGIVAIWGIFHSFTVLSSESFRGFQDLRRATTFGGVVTGSLAVTVLATVWIAGIAVDIRQVLGLFAVAAAISLSLALLALRRRIRTLGPPTPFASADLLRIALPLWVNGFLAWGLTACDLLILGMFRDKTDVAVYGAAAKLVNLVVMSLMLVNLLVPPFIAELWAKGQRARLERMLRLTATLAGAPAIVVLGIYFLLGAPLLELVYTPGYGAGATVLALLSVGRLIHVCCGSAAITLSMTGHQGALLRITMVTSILTVTAAFLAVRPYGSTGVAAAIASGIAVQNVSAWLAARRRTGMWTHVALPRLTELKELLPSIRSALR